MLELPEDQCVFLPTMSYISVSEQGVISDIL